MYDRFTITGGRKPFKLFVTNPYNLNAWIKTPLQPDAAAGAFDRNVTVKSHSKRQYPGDSSTVNVKGVTLQRVVDPSRGSGAALPGRTIAIKGLEGDSLEWGVRRMTLLGAWIDFHAWWGENVAYDCIIYNHRGTSYKIKKI